VEDDLPCFIHGWLPRSNLEATPATPLTVLSLRDHSSDGLDVDQELKGSSLAQRVVTGGEERLGGVVRSLNELERGNVR